jgi:hypothetical protein
MKASDLLRRNEQPAPVDPESREGKLAALAERRKLAANAAPEDRFSYVEGSWGDVGYTLTAADFTTEELVALADGCYLDAYKDEGMGGNGTKWRLKAAPATTELTARGVMYNPPGRPSPINSATVPPTPPNDPSRGR